LDSPQRIQIGRNRYASKAVTSTKSPQEFTFSPPVRVGNLLFISGTTATDENMRIVGKGDVVAQTHFIFQKFARLLPHPVHLSITS
jgi:enamine deaminase RidA (YjgF/YER057c/UK114 family)